MQVQTFLIINVFLYELYECSSFDNEITKYMKLIILSGMYNHVHIVNIYV